MKASILKYDLLRTITDCLVNSVAAISVSARAYKIDWTAPDCMRWFIPDFTDGTNIFVPEWEAKCLKRGLCGDDFSGVVHARVASCYVDKCRDANMSHEYAKVA